MKTIDISDRGIKIIEDGEIINQGLFNEEKDIPQEIRELLSIYENSDTVILKIQINIDEETLYKIKNIIKECNWTLKEKKTINKKLLIVFSFIIFLELLTSGMIFFKIFKIEKEKPILKKEILNYRKNISQINEEINKVEDSKKETKDYFIKSDVSKYLIFLSEVCKISNIYLEKIEFRDNRIFLTGYGNEIENIFNLKKYTLREGKILKSKYDFIKKEGEILYFLMELEKD